MSDSEREGSSSNSESSYDPEESESETSSSEEEVEAPRPPSRKRGMESLVPPPGKRLKMTTIVRLETDSDDSSEDEST